MTVQITFVSRGHQPKIILQHIQNSQPTIPNDPTTSEPSVHISARPTTGRGRRATVNMLELGGMRSSALPCTAAFSSRPSETGRSSEFLRQSVRTSIRACTVHVSSPLTLIGPRSVDPRPRPKHHTPHSPPHLYLHTLPAPACPPASSHNNNERRPGSSSTFRPRLRRRLSEPSVSRHLIESNKLFAGPYPITSRPPPEPAPSRPFRPHVK